MRKQNKLQFLIDLKNAVFFQSLMFNFKSVKQALLALSILAGVSATPAYAKQLEQGIVNVSYYAHYFHGRTQANGKPFNMHAMTAAHKSLPFGTRVKITNISNNKSVIVTITDRGPYIKGRVFDLSYGAFKQITPISQGVARVKYQILK